MLARRLSAALLVLALAARAGAQAPDDEQRARRLSDEGLAHFSQGRYREAVESFNASFAVKPLPVLLFNIAQAYRLDGDCPRALEFYRRYLRETPDPPNRQLVDGFIAEMERCERPAPAPAPVVPPVVVAPPPERPPPTVVVTAPPAAPARPVRQPLYQKWWLWTTVAVVVVAGGVGLGVGLSGGGGPPSPSLGTVSWKP